MCTVTFIPQGDNHFILTSNRDETPARSPQSITAATVANRQLLFPRDEEAGGTWIAAASDHRVICILNGAFERHERQPPYRLSRGLMALKFFEYPSAPDFFDRFSLAHIEPFTMIVFAGSQLYELRWDGRQQHLRSLDPLRPHIWSSATLYEPAIRRKREQWFDEWRQRHSRPDLAAILDFHYHAGEGDAWNDVIMNRGGIVRTVSVTSIIKSPEQIEMRYHDLVREQLKEAKIDLRGQVVGSN